MQKFSAHRKSSLVVFFIALPCLLFAKEKVKTNLSGFDKTTFHRYWQTEVSDSLHSQLKFSRDTLEITTRGGFTLWRKEKLSGNIEISYSACVKDEGRPGDRLSDLNCFWMASDPLCLNNIFKRAKWRNGVFERYYSLKMYYLGYGGNHNSTTRFRRYDGDWMAFTEKKVRPSVITEYTDSAHLLKPNHWYKIRILSIDNHIQLYMDDNLIVDYYDKNPYKSGWFGFRTTWSRVGITGFKVSKMNGK